MTIEEVRQVVEDAISQKPALPWWTYLIWLAVAATGSFSGTYFREKGKNAATKEDVSEITRQVEDIRVEYTKDVESLKADLTFISRQQSLLFDEKIRVFKKLQAQLVSFKKYCDLSAGSLGYGGEFQPNLADLAEGSRESSLMHLTGLRETMQEDFIFLSADARKVLSEFLSANYIMASMEQGLSANKDDSRFVNGAITMYHAEMEKIDACLLALYEDIEGPINSTHGKQNPWGK